MRRIRVGGSHSRRLIAILTFAAIVAGAASVDAASLSLSWDAPTTDVDGAPLSDLAGYRVYFAATPPNCPGGPFFTVASATTTPAPGDTISSLVTRLDKGAMYFMRVTAVDFDGNEGPCSDLASGIARLDFSVTASAGTSFGSVLIGSVTDRNFTVLNTGTATISGGVSVGAPFSILSGGSFSLAPGASQTVTVRFVPVTPGTFAGNVNFTANGETLSLGVSGSATLSGSPESFGPPDAPGSLSVTPLGADAAGVTFAIAWGAASGATSYSYGAAFTDGSAVQQGTITGFLSFQLRMPYHVSGAASGGIICLWSINAAGQQSTDQSCAALTVPAPSAGLPPPPSANPVPVSSSLSPASAVAGGAGLTLIVNGSGFVASSVVRWNGATRTTTFVSATQLRAAIAAADLATARTVSVSVFTPTPGGGTSGTLSFTVTAPPPPLPPSAAPPAPGTPSVTQIATDATGVTFLVVWGAASGATSYSYGAAFNDGSAAQQGTVTGLLSFQLRMPYHASGAPFGGFVCLRSIDAAGQTSADQACTVFSVPAAPGSQPPSNPVPVLGSLSPASAVAGGAGLLLTVNGSGFVTSSVVLWDGAPRTTAFVSATQLRAVITAADLASARTVSVSVGTPSPGGGTSRTVSFTVTAPSAPPPSEPPPPPPIDPP
jgi:hypothetical protein